jgi:hypothetical protein
LGRLGLDWRILRWVSELSTSKPVLQKRPRRELKKKSKEIRERTKEGVIESEADIDSVDSFIRPCGSRIKGIVRASFANSNGYKGRLARA